MLCSNEECDKTATQRGMCDNHYMKWYRKRKKEEEALGPEVKGTPLDLDFTQAACVDADPDIFFSTNESANETYNRAGLRLAKQICSECVLKEQCFQYAVDNDLQGIWGGLTRRERFARVSERERPALTAKQREVMALNNRERTLKTNAINEPLYKSVLNSNSEWFTPKAKAIIEARLNNPDLSAKELIPLIEYTVTRDMIASTLRRARDEARTLQEIKE